MSSKVPTFFFSHTRQDRMMHRKLLERFFEDLTAEVAQWAGADLEVESIGTIDREVLQGADWDRELSGRLSTDKAFVAIMTPFYFKRANCGKELYGFLLRSKKIGIDVNGALTDVENVLPIRWLREEAYQANTLKDALIPPILRRINDTPEDPGGDADRTKAIQDYRRKGMKNCVMKEPEYTALLELFALRIRDLVELPAASDISFATLEDAFKYNWKQHFAASAAPLPDSSVKRVAPLPLASVVAFYVTNRPFTTDPHTVSFADQLIAEPSPSADTSSDPLFDALLADVREAGFADRFTVFHAASNPVVPTDSNALLDRLASLSDDLVLTALVVDPKVWPGTAALTPGAAVVEEIIRSPRWVGPVILPSLGTDTIDVDKLVKALDLPPRLVALSQASEERVATLRRAFIEARGRLLRKTPADAAPIAEPLPVLKGVGAEGE